MSNGKFALATAEQKAVKINEVVTKKVFGKQKTQKKRLRDPLEATGFSILVIAFMGVFMIIPSIVIGIFSGIGAAFEVGLKKTLETYKGR